ncbi:hypothetical protein [Hoylesella pleuritidis]|uniref:hypothetical protein n=1 Tax=Hoylesella pleuritidis TaxID=407975 RepID=UPI0028E6AE05|nr:hypothetical protein [Hoylesella pleuritidis]
MICIGNNSFIYPRSECDINRIHSGASYFVRCLYPRSGCAVVRALLGAKRTTVPGWTPLYSTL